MASQKLLGLPSITPELKSISPYLQRADELRQKEPIIAYWSAYHAAQVGISIKAKDTPSRTFLFELLGTLEAMKTAIGPNDALDIEVASSAYVENFALRVFAAADNEDRKGIATRSTAKKFLAAANFMEVLKVFPQSDVAESNGEKIRYAKWKAADISKAFREGRQPVPGPPGGLGEDELLALAPSTNSEVTLAGTASNKTSPTRTSAPGYHQSLQSESPSTPSRPPPLDPSSLGPAWGGQGELTPSGWSNVATPGAASPGLNSATTRSGPESPTPGKHRKKTRSGSGSSSGSTASIIRGSSPSSTGSKKSVHFTPSTAGSMPSSPTADAQINYGSNRDFIPPPPVMQTHEYHGEHLHPSAPPHVMQNHEHHGEHLHPSAPPLSNVYAQPSAPHVSYSPQQIYAAPEPVLELTPAIIAKAQKHCRFAISSLDYEDAEQAKKELRAALKALGG
ncbi:Vta1 like-domain-containing protein [Mycena floridula]|nr:Vta1 like-domain-containing protein [Mycena floridula]